jgi:hypothetical protein
LKTTQILEEKAHNTLLASVAACDLSREKVVHKLDQLLEDGTLLFNDLLVKGESIEAQLQAKLKGRNIMDGKIKALFAKFGFGKSNQDEQLDRLSERVDNLIDVVAKLVQQKTAAKKSEIKPVAVSSIALDEEKPTTVAAKTAVKKPVTKKPKATKTVAKTPTIAVPKVVKPRVRKTVSKTSTPSAE